MTRHKIQFYLSDSEYKAVIEGKGENSWENFCISHPNVQEYLKAKFTLEQIRLANSGNFAKEVK